MGIIELMDEEHHLLQDKNGTGDSHAAAGDGTIDFPAVMQVVRHSCVVPVIEIANLEGITSSIERQNRPDARKALCGFARGAENVEKRVQEREFSAMFYRDYLQRS
jgi:sugar phosphate isomerase/epimerase